MKPLRSLILCTMVLALVFATPQRAAHANISGSISLDTSGLVGPFELAFIFTDGSGTGDANNSATLTDFLFGIGGSAGAVAASLTTGGASGNLTSGISLVDSSFLNVFASSFNPGNFLFFKFALTTNLDAGGTPDQFSLALLETDGSPVATPDPSDALLFVNVDSARPGFNVFRSDLTPAPLVAILAVVPEPPILLLVLAGLMAALRSSRSRR